MSAEDVPPQTICFVGQSLAPHVVVRSSCACARNVCALCLCMCVFCVCVKYVTVSLVIH